MEILDANFGFNTSQLSNFQLVGILAERKKLPNDIIEKAETEFILRKIDQRVISELEEKYASFHAPLNENVAWNSFIQIPLIILCICFLLLFSSMMFLLVSISIVLISIYAIKLKIEQGELMAKKYWNYFAIFYLILIPIVILVGILI